MTTKSYLIPEKTLTAFAENVFIPLKNGQCVTTLWVAGAGRRFRINFLLNEKKILQNLFGSKFSKTLFVHVHPEDIIDMNNLGYLELISQSLQREAKKRGIIFELSENNNPLQTVQKNLSKIITKGYEVIFILNDFEILLNFAPTIFLNLESIHSLNKSKIRFLFMVNRNILEEKLLLVMGNLKYALLRNIVYVPLFDSADTDYLINLNASVFNLEISEPIKTKLKSFFGGHALLLKYALGITKQFDKKFQNDWEYLKNTFLNNLELNIAVKEIYNNLNSKEKEIISSVLNTKSISKSCLEEAKYLLDTGIIVKDNTGKAKIFADFFTYVFEKEQPILDLVISPINGQIIYKSTSCLDEFTSQEYNVLKHFVMNKGQIINREEIAQVLWGKESLDKYSDWAIDKIISTIRKKLMIIGFPAERLVTLKKRGFKLS